MKQTSNFKKAQTAEILNFLILVVVVTIVIIGLKTVVIDQKITTSGTAQSSHEEGSFRSGVNAFMVMTEEASGKTFLELLGYVGFLENTSVDLGGKNNPLVVNVTEEVTKRLDAIYGEGHWNLILPIPYRTGVQIFVVTDTSRSMCDDILNLKTEVPGILKELKKADKETTIDLYFIENQATCYWKNRTTGEIYTATVTCADFAGIDDFYCHALSEKESECSYKHGNDEDWGNGVACISEAGPGESGWNDFTIRIGMPLSDELTRSSDCGCTEGGCADPQRKSLDNGIESAKKNKVKIFPLKADSCGIICFESSCSNPPPADLTIKSTGASGITYCQCGTAPNGLLAKWMTEMGNETGGQMFDLADGSTSTAQAIRDVVLNQTLDRDPIVLGSPLPGGKRIRSFIVAAPMPNYEYLNLTLKQWN